MAGFTTTLSLILTAGGMAASAYGSRKQAKAAEQMGVMQQEAAESTGQLFDFNATVAELQAADALERGKDEASRFRSSVRGLIGSQRAGIAASNIDVGFGSALEVQADAAFLGELDALRIVSNSEREAWGFKVEADDLRRRGQIARKEGAFAAEAGRMNANSIRIGAVGNLLGQGASLLQSRYGFSAGDYAPATPYSQLTRREKKAYATTQAMPGFIGRW